MNVTVQQAPPRPRFHPDAYHFLFAALQYTQQARQYALWADGGTRDEGHVSAGELLAGLREYALREYGPLARTVFAAWGVRSTDDFGTIVFELIEQGEMRATERDRIEDFQGVYDFESALVDAYAIVTDAAFA